VLQYVEVCCSVWKIFLEPTGPSCVSQCVAVRCSVLQCVAVCCSVLQCIAVCCGVLQCVAVSDKKSIYIVHSVDYIFKGLSNTLHYTA